MKPRRGRPPKPEDEVLVPINFRASKREKAVLLRAAKWAKKSLSEWIRTSLLSSAAKILDGETRT